MSVRNQIALEAGCRVRPGLPGVMGGVSTKHLDHCWTGFRDEKGPARLIEAICFSSSSHQMELNALNPQRGRVVGGFLSGSTSF